jgi:hypothetical protein
MLGTEERIVKLVRTDELVSAWALKHLNFEADAMQERVLESQSKRGILNCSRQWGKSTVAAVKAAHRAYTSPGSLVLVVAPSARQSAELVSKMQRGMISRLIGYRTSHSLELRNGSRILGLPGSEAKVRGFSSATMVVVDEAARVSDEMYRALRPMVAISDGELWLLSTPYGKRGFFFEEWQRGSGWERIQVTGPECPRIPTKFLRQERRSMGKRAFGQEYLCEFQEVEGVVFEEEAIDRAFKERVEPLEVA